MKKFPLTQRLAALEAMKQALGGYAVSVKTADGQTQHSWGPAMRR